MSYAVKKEFPMPDGTLIFQGTMSRGRNFKGMIRVVNGSGDCVIGPWYRDIRAIAEMPENPPAAYLHDVLFELRDCDVFDLRSYHNRIIKRVKRR